MRGSLLRVYGPRITAMEAQQVTISLQDESGGYAISPDRVPLAVLKDFTKSADEFLRGEAGEFDTSKLDVSVVKGSVSIVTQPILHPSLFNDLRHLGSSELLESIDSKRREVIERWQKLARGTRRCIVRIAAPILSQPLVISAATDFRADDADQWVRVERYLQGEVTHMGGVQKTNAHIRLPDGKVLLVESDRQVFKDDKLNRLYKIAMVRITAEYNVVTREYRNARLLAFEEHQQTLDEAQIKRLTERGAKAWKDVPNATSWVDEMRGGGD